MQGQPPDAVRVRRASPDDAVAIAEVHVATWRAAYAGLVPDEHLAGLDVGARAGWWRTWLADPPPRTSTFVAERAADGRVVGFVNAGRARDDDADGDVGQVWAIYAHPDAWSTGAGRALMAAAAAALAGEGFTSATLWVLEGNDRARRFYAAAGWTPDGATQTENIGGADLVEVRYRRPLAGNAPAGPAGSAPGNDEDSSSVR